MPFNCNNILNIQKTIFFFQVQKRIEDVSFIMLTTFSQFGSAVQGAGPERNIFPVVYPVHFNGSYTGGPATSVEFTFACPGLDITPSTELDFERSFPSSGGSLVCDVALNLENDISEAGK